jgi:pimeloyl-ACP methyl ester carboxylesterase
VSEAKEIADAIPGAVLHVVPHTGHLSTLERPEAVSNLLESFLLERT